MDVGQMQRQWIDYTKSLFLEVTHFLFLFFYFLFSLFKLLVVDLLLGCFQFLNFFFLFSKRGSWMVSFCNFSSFKMRTTLTLSSKSSLSSSKILKGFSKISPLRCQYRFLLSTLNFVLINGN